MPLASTTTSRKTLLIIEDDEGFHIVRVLERKEAGVTPLPGGTARVVFDDPVRAVAPGQAAVFYAGDVVLGGGWIAASVR